MTTTPGTWVPITCEDRERFIHATTPPLTVLASRTDLGGAYGPAEIYTEWGTPDGRPVLREHRYPDARNADGGSYPDVRPCEHYRWEATGNPDATIERETTP